MPAKGARRRGIAAARKTQAAPRLKPVAALAISKTIQDSPTACDRICGKTSGNSSVMSIRYAAR
ncbi:hypothetical protein I546_2170 [Mycobacterium kansasii 732]|nr:hypothetical protein I546_2170 [Mycobacterium kansasii 732]